MSTSLGTSRPSGQPLYQSAVRLLGDGLPAEEVRLRLVDEGHDPHDVFVILRHLGGARAVALEDPAVPATPPGTSALLILGGVVVVLGAVLTVGNVSGLFPTFPYAGYLLMASGVGLMGKGTL